MNVDTDEHMENMMITLSILEKSGFDFSNLADNCHKLERMMSQKTAGQKSGKDISFNKLFMLKANIICEALALVRLLDKKEASSNEHH